jgi:hypothetical protein
MSGQVGDDSVDVLPRARRAAHRHVFNDRAPTLVRFTPSQQERQIMARCAAHTLHRTLPDIVRQGRRLRCRRHWHVPTGRADDRGE